MMVAAALLVMVPVIYRVRTQMTTSKVELSTKGKEDLSMFANSAVSFYDPGDTAPDSDILPREVLEDDGSRIDREDAQRKSASPNYGNAHWYKAGQSADFHGDLQEENRNLERREKNAEHKQRVQAERREKAADRRREHRDYEERKRSAHRRVERILRERRTDEAHERYESQRHRASSRQERIREEREREAKNQKTSFAYRHPFAADKKGLGNLVKAEFQQDEQRMKATTNAIFGDLKANHQWSHGGLLITDVNQAPPRTLHEAMEARHAREYARRDYASHEKSKELSEEARFVHPRQERGRDRRRRTRAPCTIEMLENGGCSDSHQVKEHEARRRFATKKDHKIQLKLSKHEDHQIRNQVVAPNAAPTAGSVISGWVNDVGSLFR
ncbi:hypothetical protein GUITHDRAFT_151671 [Guillardia theta CCMP2712]|uniref:Uncharacterized protein n=1 Tax=Guillardia theta (strain CCMP2712) TaxID=905079 RepID=L1JKQ5_GUITC|nr:hypothetical protein GUITHDRAFT_151671 [Guillardia theta CCMP2712]EKX48719.1 hypothetical protein GUITHDRAFT_151671 [Guillardia theta CCMP2712]|eukprot:XP_005835699.1 hypothetical protein GUITHDRAFT_151671 [Guillardia theta CCMP2712]